MSNDSRSDIEKQRDVGIEQELYDSRALQDIEKEQDYDSRADKLWSIYNKEAESYDRALMETWKDDMDSIIIFAGLFSAVLTAFLVDTSKQLQPDPADRTNALLNQTVFLLAQISQQLAPNGSQTTISLPQPLEQFKLKSSDLRVNIFWFMSLGFSITAALGATLVQQWVRNHLRVFQQLSGSLQRSRMRQFLFHGLNSNHLHLLVDLIPTLIHISLFLFFIGLADKLFGTNNAVAIATTAIAVFCAVFYLVCSIFPLLYVQTPFHTPLSDLFWKMRQFIRPRKYHTEGNVVPVSSDMADGRFQLAMSYNRMARDKEAIYWVVTKITEDSEFEPLAASIGGSLATLWGRDVWTSIFRESEDLGSTRSTSSDTVQALKIRLDSLLRSCTISTFTDQPTRFTRACICVDAVASFVEARLHLGIHHHLMNRVLGYLGDEKKRQEKLAQEAETSSGSALIQVMDTSLEIKWKCLMLIGMNALLHNDIDTTSETFFVRFHGTYLNPEEYRIYEKGAITNTAKEVDRELSKAWNAAQQLFLGLCQIPEESLTQDKLPKDFVPVWRGHINTMQESLIALNVLVHPSIDEAVERLRQELIWITRSARAFEHLDTIFCEWPSTIHPLTIRKISEKIDWKINPSWQLPDSFIPHLIPPRLLICHLLVCADPSRRADFDASKSQIDLVGLGRLLSNPEMQRLFDTQGGIVTQPPQPYVNQFWRFEDIREHKGVGFMVEMFFATFRSLQGKFLASESKQLLQATLRVIIGGESEYLGEIAIPGFLCALRQDLDFLMDVIRDEQLMLGEALLAL